jgi:hypothetical protein
LHKWLVSTPHYNSKNERPLREKVGAFGLLWRPAAAVVYPTIILVSERNLYSGTSRLYGAGPRRMRPDAS